MKNMKMNRGISVALLMALTLSTSSLAPKAFATDATAPGKIVITSSNLDEVLFANNPDSINAMNAVMKARDQVSIARAALLPSLSLNVILAIANPPMFMINSISCLVPFLFPAAWYDFRAARAGAGAEIMAFHITRLNVYSQAYALTEQVGADTDVLVTMEAHDARLKDYLKALQLQADLGVIPQFEVNRAQLEVGRYEMDMSSVRQLVDEERAAIRKLFGLNIGQEFDIQMAEVAPSPFENQSAAASLEDIVARAPERKQIDLLIVQAQAQVRSAQWAWLGGCQGNQGGFSTNSPTNAFSIATGVQINVGFGIYPRVQLARRNVVDMIHRQGELKLELGHVLETSVADIREIKLRMAQAEQNAAVAEQMLSEQTELLSLGKVSVRDMLETYASISNARTASLANHSALDGHRITLKRVALEDGFLKVFINSRHALELGGH